MFLCVPIAACGQIFRAGKPAFTEGDPLWAFTNLFPMSQKPGEGLVTSVLCSEPSLQPQQDTALSPLDFGPTKTHTLQMGMASVSLSSCYADQGRASPLPSPLLLK